MHMPPTINSHTQSQPDLLSQLGWYTEPLFAKADNFGMASIDSPLRRKGGFKFIEMDIPLV